LHPSSDLRYTEQSHCRPFVWVSGLSIINAKKIFTVDCEFDVARLEDPNLKIIKKDIDLQLEWYRFNRDKHVPKKNELPNRPEKLAMLIAAVKRYNARESSGESSGADAPVVEPILQNDVNLLDDDWGMDKE
jgi:hypothetical protein